MKKILTFCLVAAFLAAVSCVKDPNYTMEKIKKTDMEMTFFEEGLTLPFTLDSTIVLGDLLKSDQVVADPSGNLALKVNGNLSSTEITVPEISIPKPGIQGVVLPIDLGDLKGQTIPSGVSHTCNVTGQTTVGISTNLPEGILDVKSIKFNNFNVNITLTQDFGFSVLLKSGFKIVFPEGFEVSTSDSDVTVSGNTATLSSNYAANPSRVFHFTVTKINVASTAITGGQLKINGLLKFSGSFTVSGPVTMPSSASFNVSSTVADGFAVKETEVKVNKETKVAASNINLEIPEFLHNGESVVKFDGPSATLVISKNPSPVALVLSGKIGVAHTTPKLGEVVPKALEFSIPIAANTTTPTQVVVSESTIPGFDALLNFVPDIVMIYDLNVVASSGSGYVTVGAGEKFSVNASYNFNCPLAFKQGTSLSYQLDATPRINFSGLIINSLGFRIKLENKCGFDLLLNPSIYVDNEVIKMKPVGKDEFKIPANSSDEYIITVSKADGSQMIEVTQIDFKASIYVSSGVAKINSANALKYNLYGLSVPDGVTFDMN